MVLSMRWSWLPRSSWFPFWKVFVLHLQIIKNKKEYTLFPIKMLCQRFPVDLFFTKT